MARRHYDGGGSRHHMPLQTFKRTTGASQATYSDVLFQNVRNEFYFLEDFLGDLSGVSGDLEIAGKFYNAAAAGSTTKGVIANSANGILQIKLASTNEQETVGYTWNDQLVIDSSKPFYYETRLTVATTAITTNQILVFGLASAVNTATLDNLTRNIWFRMDGSMAVVYELDDNTTDTDDQSSGITAVAATHNIFSIEKASNGTVYYAITDGDGQNDSVVGTIDGSGLSGNVQPVIILQKASGTTTPEVNQDYFLVIAQRV